MRSIKHMLIAPVVIILMAAETISKPVACVPPVYTDLSSPMLPCEPILGGTVWHNYQWLVFWTDGSDNLIVSPLVFGSCTTTWDCVPFYEVASVDVGFCPPDAMIDVGTIQVSPETGGPQGTFGWSVFSNIVFPDTYECDPCHIGFGGAYFGKRATCNKYYVTGDIKFGACL